MPKSINPFAAAGSSIAATMTTLTTSPPRQSGSSSLDISERSTLRRSSLSKANQRLAQFFSTSPKQRNADTAAPQAPTHLHSYLSSAPYTQPSLPTISLSTAIGEKSKLEERTTTLFAPPSPAEARRIAKSHAQFGPLGSQAHKYSSRYVGGAFPQPIEDEPRYYVLLTTYISYLILIILGHIRDFFGKRFRKDRYKNLMESDGYAPINSDFDNFYVRRLKMRLNDCFARPVTGVPGRFVTLIDRKSQDDMQTFQFTGTFTETLNMSSYNYLGFAQSDGPCADAVETALKKYGLSMSSPRSDVGTSELHVDVEELIARFVGKPAAMVFSMGFGTNATAFPALVGKGDLVISDELNHSSIRTGARMSGAMVQTFKHNNMHDLESLLRDVISQGQPRTHRPWKKILVAVEGLYSMEGTMCNLPALIELRRRYKFYLFVDEAHSIGALGPRGRGVCDYFGVDPNEVDLLMGTLTKSFGANGGYICAAKTIIDKLRVTNAGTVYGESPTPPVLMQIATSLRMIHGEIVPGQGEERLQRLAFNSRYLRLGLKRLGFIVYGHDDSPIIPVLLYNPAKMPAFSREMLRRKISVVVVGYPATPLVSSRARFCVSAAHTKDDLDRLLEACSEVGDVLDLKYSSGIAGGSEPIPDGLTNEEERKITNGEKKKRIVPPRWRVQDVVRSGVEDVKVPLR